jgi:hypothetical protein
MARTMQPDSPALLTIACLLLFLGSAVADNSGATCHSISFCHTCPFNETAKKNVCTKCFELYAVNDGKYPFCVPCNSFDGCWVCSSTKVCDLCRYPTTHGPDYNGHATCSPCGDNCRTCKTAGGGKCDICKPGYSMYGGSTNCRQCLDNCASCNGGDGACDFCSPGYYKLNPTTCSQCIGNCSVCSNGLTCNYCNSGFYYDDFYKRCLPCWSTCRTCTSLTSCKTCNPGYIMASQGFCYQECPDNCVSCNTNTAGVLKCDKCADGYTRTSEQTCQRTTGSGNV